MKDDIRRDMRRLRDNFQGEARQAADSKIFKNFISAFCNFNSFFVYNSFKSEVDTSRITAQLINDGKRVYLPRVEGENILPVPYGKLEKGAFGISEPKGNAFTGDIEITIIPLLAVNDRGFRIGYGRGFYDRYLKNAKTVKVGLCYDFQKAEFKEDEWDEPLDIILNESGILKIK